jgi:hypothetical protein
LFGTRGRTPAVRMGSGHHRIYATVVSVCVKHNHACIPQLDLIATQWGVDIEDTLSHNKLGSPRSKREKQRRRGTLEQQMRNQAKEPRRRIIGEDIADPIAGPFAGRPQQKS